VNQAQALVILDHLSIRERQRQLSEVERCVFIGCWNNKGFRDIALESKYKLNYLQTNIAPKLWSLISVIAKEPITKHKVKAYFNRLDFDSFIEEHKFISEQEYNAEDTGEELIGRSSELEYLIKEIQNKTCIGVFGAEGVGKTLLLNKCLSNSEIKTKWSSIIRRNVLHDSVHQIISDLIVDMGYPVDTEYPYRQFIQIISQARFLIILDSADDIFNVPYGSTQWTENRKFLKTISDKSQASCIIISCRAVIPELKLLQNKETSVGILKLEGLKLEDAKVMLRKMYLSDEEDWEYLLARHGTNPLDLKIISSYIRNYFNGSVAQYNKFNTIFLGNELEQRLNSQCAELSELHKKILKIMTVSSTGGVAHKYSLTDLRKDYPESGLFQILQELEDKSLIESCPGDEPCWKILPFIGKFISSLLKDKEGVASL
jgi:hypothetical protein